MQSRFEPPRRSPDIDIFEHLWTTKRAISSWSLEKPNFVEIRVCQTVLDELKWHPRVCKNMIHPSPVMNSVWGIPLRVDNTLATNPGYVFIYIEKDF